jgi:hypothetical protein
MSNSIKANIRKNLLNGIAKQAGVIELETKLENARAGMYTHGVLAAIAAKGDAQAFTEVCDTLRDDFRANRRNIAVKYNCDIAKDKQGNAKSDSDGNPVYKVPSALSSMASHLKAAFEFGVDVGTAKKPAAFSAIRTAVSVARDEKAKADATPEDKLRDGLREQLADLSERLGELDARQLKIVAKLINSVGKAVVDAQAA